MIKEITTKRKERADTIARLAAKLASVAGRMKRYGHMESWTSTQESKFEEIERQYKTTMREINSLTHV